MACGVKTLARRVTLCALMGMAWPAYGQQPQRQTCAPRAALVERLSAEFGETPIASGIDGGGQLLEILTSPSGTWTLLIVIPGKTACIIGSGDGWREYEPTVPGRGA